MIDYTEFCEIMQVRGYSNCPLKDVDGGVFVGMHIVFLFL